MIKHLKEIIKHLIIIVNWSLVILNDFIFEFVGVIGGLEEELGEFFGEGVEDLYAFVGVVVGNGECECLLCGFRSDGNIDHGFEDGRVLD